MKSRTTHGEPRGRALQGFLRCICGLALLLALPVEAQNVLPPPTNAPQTVTLAWDKSPGTNIASYWIWYGAGSRQYTNKLTAGTNLTVAVKRLAWGTTYYFAATAVDTVGLESDWSTEVSYTTPMLPAAPGLKPVVVLTVQSKSLDAGALWADGGMYWSVAPDDLGKVFRLKIAGAPAVAESKVQSLKSKVLTPRAIQPPPIPGE
jgi:hypothetical protein